MRHICMINSTNKHDKARNILADEVILRNVVQNDLFNQIDTTGNQS